MNLRLALASLAVLGLAACAGAPTRPGEGAARGGYYKDDGPGERAPDPAMLADAQPRREPLMRGANQPYDVFGKHYVPFTELRPFTQRGVASWYGRRFQGQKTSSGEAYDMYAMTAAHPLLPIPSYARVTNLANGKSVVVRINDRGPFHSNRIVDLSYAAAYKLGYTAAGSTTVELQSIIPGEQPERTASAQAAPAAAEPVAAAEPSGVYLQLGAFSARDSAESYRAAIYRRLAWLTDQIYVFASGSLYKLHLGPYPSEADASAIAARIETEMNLKPVFVVR
ncbi:MAG TPA: septal ring lytic transglycosylase RlpA family protein [Burkholderiales bacterium]|nr:septal ring lytic transglycosylase RlpA family protein [Burkholderiales bacterium]